MRTNCQNDVILCQTLDLGASLQEDKSASELEKVKAKLMLVQKNNDHILKKNERLQKEIQEREDEEKKRKMNEEIKKKGIKKVRWRA